MNHETIGLKLNNLVLQKGLVEKFKEDEKEDISKMSTYNMFIS